MAYGSLADEGGACVDVVDEGVSDASLVSELDCC